MKKLLLIIALFGISLTLTACGTKKEVFNCFEFTEMFKQKGANDFVEVNNLRKYKSYTITLYPRSMKFEVKEQYEDVNEVYTGTYTRKSDLNGKETLTFTYDSEFMQKFGEEVYEVKNGGKELHFYKERNLESSSGNILGPITKKFKIKDSNKFFWF